jgi:hypothetical protein
LFKRFVILGIILTDRYVGPVKFISIGPFFRSALSEVRENGALNVRKPCKTAKTGVLRRRFTSVRNTTKIGGENDGRLLAKKRLVKRADVLRQNTVKF